MSRMTEEICERLAKLTKATSHECGYYWLFLHFRGEDYAKKSEYAYALLNMYGIQYDPQDSTERRIDIERTISDSEYAMLESLL